MVPIADRFGCGVCRYRILLCAELDILIKSRGQRVWVHVLSDRSEIETCSLQFSHNDSKRCVYQDDAISTGEHKMHHNSLQPPC